MAGINSGVVLTELARLGGVMASGHGRGGWRRGVDEFLDIKYLLVAGLQQPSRGRLKGLGRLER